MKILPDEKLTNKKALSEAKQIKTDKITRIVALVAAFISVFFFIIKIMFL